MTGPAGEMPFLDHLEELRARILKSLGALVIAFALGLWLVDHFQLVLILEQPILPYLHGSKLVVLSPTEPIFITFELGFFVGVLFASPVILYQLWAFLSPALYKREQRALVPALFVGVGLFLTGSVLAYRFVLPQALRVFFSFQTDAVTPMITYDAYFGVVLQIVLALGLSFELPLAIIILAIFGLVTPEGMNRFRRVAIVVSCVAGAVLSPGTDVISMIMMTIPLILLYEVGFAGTVLIARRRRKLAAEAGTAALLLLLLARPAGAQQPTTPQPPRVAPVPGQPMDSTAAGRLGLPTHPSRSFAPEDSALRALLARPGYQSIRFQSDSATLFTSEKRILLDGHPLTEREGATLEADSTISYRQESCVLEASGDPKLFDQTQVLLGEGIVYDTCRHRGVVRGALTDFRQGATVWFLRGNVAADSSTTRIYAGAGELTSCNLPVPHYHFGAREVKWVSNTILVARPVVLYIRDVPVLWLPFLFQDLRPGRHSGILVPQVGFSDIVRPSRNYNRQITNIGYYWAPNEYIDLTGRVDWYSRRYLQYGVSGQYRWLNRFMTGSFAYSQQRQNGGGSANTIRWDHRQTLNLSTSLNFSINYVSNSTILQQNAIDPLLNTQQISSTLNLSKRYRWGAIAIGGNRRQSLSDSSVTQQLPSLSISPKPIDFGRNVTWSPGLSLTNDQSLHTPLAAVVIPRLAGGVDTVQQTGDTRVTALTLDTPLRIGTFNWRNGVSVVDQTRSGRQVVTFRAPNPATPDPTDSVTVSQAYTSDFSTGVNWDTGINLPILFQRSWKVQPVLGITNVTSGPFALRNRNTFGAFVTQGKRLQLALTSSPTFFAFLPGFFPGVTRIRHSISPLISFTYSPAASISDAYARAISVPGQPVLLRSEATQTLSVSLSQSFEGKGRSVPGDSTGASARKFRLLSVTTSPLSYDFELARQPGRRGWTSQTISNSLLSDLLPGFNLSVAHDLWRGDASSDTATFSPFLQSVNASFSLSSRTLQSVLGAVGLGKRNDRPRTGPGSPPVYPDDPLRRLQPGSFSSTGQLPLNRGRGFTATVNYSLARSRQPAVPVPGVGTQRQSVNLSTAFSPTAFWSVSWATQYNLTDRRFESQTVQLERDLHEWRASFNFQRNANGNVAFYFAIFLTDVPALKFNFNRTSIE